MYLPVPLSSLGTKAVKTSKPFKPNSVIPLEKLPALILTTREGVLMETLRNNKNSSVIPLEKLPALILTTRDGVLMGTLRNNKNSSVPLEKLPALILNTKRANIGELADRQKKCRA